MNFSAVCDNASLSGYFAVVIVFRGFQFALLQYVVRRLGKMSSCRLCSNCTADCMFQNLVLKCSHKLQMLFPEPLPHVSAVHILKISVFYTDCVLHDLVPNCSQIFDWLWAEPAQHVEALDCPKISMFYTKYVLHFSAVQNSNGQQVPPHIWEGTTGFGNK